MDHQRRQQQEEDWQQQLKNTTNVCKAPQQTPFEGDKTWH
jgi:hypothetical protein